MGKEALIIMREGGTDSPETAVKPVVAEAPTKTLFQNNTPQNNETGPEEPDTTPAATPVITPPQPLETEPADAAAEPAQPEQEAQQPAPTDAVDEPPGDSSSDASSDTT